MDNSDGKNPFWNNPQNGVFNSNLPAYQKSLLWYWYPRTKAKPCIYACVLLVKPTVLLKLTRYLYLDFGSILVSEQIRTYPSPNLKLTPTCYQLDWLFWTNKAQIPEKYFLTQMDDYLRDKTK